MEPNKASRQEPVGQFRRTRTIVTAGLLFVAILVAAVTFFGRQRAGQSESAASGASSSIAVVASAEQFALPSTVGADFSLAQMRGSPVVVYFYEGAT